MKSNNNDHDYNHETYINTYVYVLPLGLNFDEEPIHNKKIFNINELEKIVSDDNPIYGTDISKIKKIKKQGEVFTLSIRIDFFLHYVFNQDDITNNRFLKNINLVHPARAWILTNHEKKL